MACDGRSSTLRNAMGLAPSSFGAPMDVWWFRLPRNADDPTASTAAGVSARARCVVIDRGDYYQCAYVIPKGRDAELRAPGHRTLHRGVVPWLAGRSHHALTSFDDVKLLDVQLNRLRRWYTDGLLLIGDAAHAMSPVGGVGINLAVADAVAAAAASGRPAAPRHRLHQAVGPRAGAAVVARRADSVGAAGHPHAGHCGRRFGRSARQTSPCGADRRQGACAAHRGRICHRDRSAARTCAGVCPALSQPPPDTHRHE